MSNYFSKTPTEVPKILQGFTDSRWTNKTSYSYFENPTDFMNEVLKYKSKVNKSLDDLVEQGEHLYSRIDNKDISYNTLYQDVAKQVKEKLQSRGLTTKLLYSPVEFTSRNTGMVSKVRASLGMPDRYFTSSTVTDGTLFHDIYINLSYYHGVSNKTIERNSYALFALVKELSRVISIRVFVVNHVGSDQPMCYSYCLKKFRQVINPKEFLFFTYDSKRTFGWASYEIVNEDSIMWNVGDPTNTVSIANFNLDKEIDTIWEKIKPHIKIIY